MEPYGPLKVRIMDVLEEDEGNVVRETELTCISRADWPTLVHGASVSSDSARNQV
jgi:hypothetical protein